MKYSLFYAKCPDVYYPLLPDKKHRENSHFQFVMLKKTHIATLNVLIF